MALTLNCTCPNCGKKLHVREDLFAGNMPGCKTKEEAECPGCGNTVYSGMTAGRYVVTEI